MSETIFKKLTERIEKKKFDKIQIGHMEMWGLILSKTDWKRYQKAIPDPVLRRYTNRQISLKVMWFRGYPLKQKDD